jgi:3-hydroxyisobutyrate dehydrogenase-like beta-hydroxyacid dehydrogenase
MKTVGILSPGDMGHSVGAGLREHGLRLITCLEGRSERTKTLAEEAGIVNVESYRALVEAADLILSILVPAQAGEAARLVAEALAETKTKLIYADCNAIAPQTVRQIGQQVMAAGAGFVDASIIGPPPRRPGTRFYASGPQLADFEQLGEFGLDIRPLGEEIGQASAIKMCYAALTKGSTALITELLTAAQALGVFEALQAEFQSSQSSNFERLTGGLTRMPTKARRFVGEMEEIAATFEGVGLTPKMLAGAADMYRFIGSTSLADRAPEDDDPDPTLAELIAALAKHLS